jgi:hypothetical protein
VTESDSGGGGGTAIVIIIAVLIIIIPLGFVISCIVKKIQEKRNKDKRDGSIPLPDHSQNVSSPERPLPGGNLYPYGSPENDSENIPNQYLGNPYGGMDGGFGNQYGGAGGYMDGP